MLLAEEKNMKVRLASVDEYRRALKDGTQGDLAVRMGFNCEVGTKSEENERIVPFTISSQAVDRDDDVIYQGPNEKGQGWLLNDYRKNPVVLFGHNYWNNEAPVVGNSLAEWVEGQRLRSQMEFLPKGIVPLADTLHALYTTRSQSGGPFMRGASVGFVPKIADYTKDESRPGGIDFYENALIEWSLVPVPAHQDGLVEARSKGIETGPLKEYVESVLDAWDSHRDQNLWVPRSILADVRKQADPTQSVSVQVPKGTTDAGQEVGTILTPEEKALLLECAATVKEWRENGVPATRTLQVGGEVHLDSDGVLCIEDEEVARKVRSLLDSRSKAEEGYQPTPETKEGEESEKVTLQLPDGTTRAVVTAELVTAIRDGLVSRDTQRED